MIRLNIEAPRNRNVYFPPLSGTLAGSVRVNEIGSDRVPGSIVAVGGMIPGYQLVIDVKAKQGQVIDRLKLPEFAQVAREAAKQMGSDKMRERGFKSFDPQNFTRDPEDGVSIEEGTWQLGDEPPHNLATWLWHAKRIVDHGRAVLIDGQLPTPKQIREMGVIFLADSYGLQPKEGQPAFNYLYPPETVST